MQHFIQMHILIKVKLCQSFSKFQTTQTLTKQALGAALSCVHTERDIYNWARA